MRVKSIKYTLGACFFVILMLGLFSSNTSYAAGGFMPMPRAVIKSMIEDIEDKKVAQKAVREKAKEDIEKVEDAKELKKLAIESIDELDEQYKLLAKKATEIEEERVALEAQRNALEKERDKHEKNVKLFSMGFYGSLSAAVIAIASIIVRVPTIRLERHLKRLEIIEKEHQLKKNKVRIKLEHEGTNLLHSFFNWLKKN